MDEITNVPSDKIEAIVEILKITPAYLMGWEEKVKNAILEGKAVG